MTPELVIFDCDGVLIDSEIIACRIDAEELTAFGIPMTTEEAIRRFAGISQKDIRTMIERDIGRPLPSDYEKRITASVEKAMAGELQAVPGVREVIEQLSIPFCIASSSAPEKLKYTLRLTDLYDLFEPNIFSSSEVSNGKPAPDIFLHAAKRMDVDPTSCVVIEDSTTGVEAAVAAGMYPIGFVGGTHCHADLANRLHRVGAKRVIDRFDDLPEAISEAQLPSSHASGRY